VYLTRWDCHLGSTPTGEILRISLATGETTQIVSELSHPNSLTIAGGYLYWADATIASSSIGRVALSGGDLDRRFFGAPQGEQFRAVTSHKGRLYFSSCGRDRSFIEHLSTAESPHAQRLVRLRSDSRCATALTTDGRYLYWSQRGGDPIAGYIGRARLSGRNSDPRWWNPPIDGVPLSLLAEGGKLYWTWIDNQRRYNTFLAQADLKTHQLIGHLQRADGPIAYARQY
jgi:hypothetical protein